MHVVHDVSWMYCLTSLGYSQFIISVKSRVATRGGKDGTYQDDSTETWLHSTSLWLWDVIWCLFLYAYFAISSFCVCLCCQKLFIYIYDYICICLYIYVHSENCCWVGGRSNIRCVYIYIHITIYSYIYHSHRCLCLFHSRCIVQEVCWQQRPRRIERQSRT